MITLALVSRAKGNFFQLGGLESNKTKVVETKARCTCNAPKTNEKHVVEEKKLPPSQRFALEIFFLFSSHVKPINKFRNFSALHFDE